MEIKKGHLMGFESGRRGGKKDDFQPPKKKNKSLPKSARVC